ncbi:MAG: hypothetical protein AAGJ52_11530 [Pseudomonadota bacterium]
MNREQAIERIDDLMREHALSLGDLKAAANFTVEDSRSGEWLRPVLATLGGLFVLAGVIAGFSLVWDDLVPLARVVIVLGSGLIALVIAAMASQRKEYDKVASVFFLLAGWFQTWGLFVAVDEYVDGGPTEIHALMVFGAMAIQFALLLVWQKRLELMLGLMFFASLSFIAACNQLKIDWELVTLVMGISGMLVSWALERTAFKLLCGLSWWVYSSSMAIGAFALLESEFPLDLLLIGVGAILVQVSVLVRRRTLLALAVIVLLSYLGYYTQEYFADTLGWPIALILFGAALLAASGYAIKLGQRMGKRNS